jgi:plastocyanin
MISMRQVSLAAAAVALVSIPGCGGGGMMPSPIPPVTVTANAYILPGGVTLGAFAFGDEPVVLYKGERLRWVNLDAVGHLIVADSPDVTDFSKTDELRPGAEQSFTMTKLGTTGIHCAIHPSMTGTLIVRER